MNLLASQASVGLMWYVAAVLMGLAVGAWIVRFLSAILAHWESAETSINAVRSLITLLLGGGLGGGGAVLFASLVERDTAAYYIAGAGLGGIFGYFFPLLPKQRLTPEMISTIILAAVNAKEQFSASADTQNLIDLTSIQFLSADEYQRLLHLSKDELERRLASAADAMDIPDEENSDAPPDRDATGEQQ